MKKKYLILLCMCALLFVNCTEDNDDQLGVDIVLDWKYDYAVIWCPLSKEILLLSEGDYLVHSDDPAIATVALEGAILKIRTIKPGKTNLTIIDKKNKSNSRTLICYSREFSHNWGEHPSLQQFYKNSVQIVCSDNEVKESIKNELLNFSYSKFNTLYTFNEKTSEIHVSHGTGERHPGTYSWDWMQAVLILSYNGNTERYICDLMPPLEGSLRPPFVFSITQDLTDKYISLYKSAGIEKVELTRYICSYTDAWWSDI